MKCDCEKRGKSDVTSSSGGYDLNFDLSTGSTERHLQTRVHKGCLGWTKQGGEKRLAMGERRSSLYKASTTKQQDCSSA